MIYKALNLRILASFILLALCFSLSAQQSRDIGKVVFRNYCATCHDKTMVKDATGPALSGTEERWAAYPREDLYSWIRNSQGMIAAGHPRAVELWNQYKPTVMTSWPDLTDDEIESVLLYIAQPNDPNAVVAVNSAETAEEGSNGWLYVFLLGFLALLAFILMRVIANLSEISAAKEGDSTFQKKSVLESITSSGIVGFLIFALVILAGYKTVNNAINLGRQQGYQPDQPIAFSHEIHAGLQGIDCQYCHDGARRSKHATIPPMSTCMNCHEAVKVGTETGTSEISKIFASVGFNPNTGQYMDNYMEMSEDSIAEIFKEWITDNYLQREEKEALDNIGAKSVEEEWDNLVSSLTNDQKKQIQGPVEWVRIHNLPDHVYFNHAQHVTVGKVECQTCHGKVEEMEVLEQYSPLSMGWCVNCHRQTDVQFTGNEYYESYEKYHAELKAGTRESVKVEDIGGLECQKCHY